MNKKFKATIIKDFDIIVKEITLGEKATKQDVINALKRMGIGGEIINITEVW